MVKDLFIKSKKVKRLFCLAVLAKLFFALYQVSTAQMTLLAFSEIGKGIWNYGLFALMLAFSVGYGLVLYASLWIGKRIKNCIEFEISMQTIQNYVAGRMKQVKFGEATVQLTQDAAVASSYFEDYLIPLTEFILTCSCAVIFIALQSLLMGLLYCTMGIVYYLSARYFYNKTMSLSEQLKTHQDAFMTYFQETIRSIPLIRVFRCASWRKSEFDRLVKAQERDFRQLTDVNAKNESFLFASIYFAEFVSLSIGLLLTVTTNFSMAQLLSVFSLGINTILYQCLMVPGTFVRSVDIKTSFKRLEAQIFDISACANPVNHPDLEMSILNKKVERIEGCIGFHYPEERRWLYKNLQLSIKKGNVTWIVGSNGSGKSTLTQILMRELSPSSGQLFYLNNQGERLPGASFAFVSEDHHFFRMNLRDNLTLGQEVSNDKILGALQGVGILEEKAVENDFCDKVMFKDLQFSEGQLRRLSIIRATMVPVDFIIYDEPFSDLDRSSQERVMTMIRQTLDSTGAIIISHTYDLIQPQDQVIRLGGIVDA